ncbi:hypothetical protein F5888DRAFT_1633991 [Russula emetica]|nr:hypothetical protein F5888DRAFT_1633991 [Russula emetica]
MPNDGNGPPSVWSTEVIHAQTVQIPSLVGRHRGPKLTKAGSHRPRAIALLPLGPLMHPCFYIEGRNALSTDRGPFATRGNNRRSRAGSILARLARARPKNIIVASNDPTPILALVDWQSASDRPLWCCDDDNACRQRLRGVFRAVVANDPVFARAVDTDDTCHALDEVAECDVFRDGFLVLSTLQSMFHPVGLPESARVFSPDSDLSTSVSTPSSTISHKSHKSRERLGGWEHGSGWQREMGMGPGMGRKKGLE